jgi:AbrB family looped-hinge helix DNA binding protein
MRESLTVVTRKGQITVPAELRKLWDLREGDKVAIALPDSPEASAVIRPVRSVAEMTFGALSHGRRNIGLREQRAALMEGAVERDETSRRRGAKREPVGGEHGTDEGVGARRP